MNKFSTQTSPSVSLTILAIGLATAASLTNIGCRSKSDPAPAANETQSEAEQEVFVPQAYEATGEELLAARLDPEEASAGWIRLFDGYTLFGWEIAGNANWQVEDQTITADQGDICLINTSIPWQDYELSLEFNADEKSNSGVFLRTPIQVDDPAVECYEVNIAGVDHPFTTGSLVDRQKVSKDAPEQTFGEWRKMLIRIEGNRVQVSLDGVLVTDYTDPEPEGLPAGRIGLQHNSGRIAFRNIRLRPLGLESLLDEELSAWKPFPNMDAEYTVTQEGAMKVQGGIGQIETKDVFDDFVLLAEYKLAKPEINSGIFFRCIPGDTMMGYECQLNDGMNNGLPLKPSDCGTGGIFRHQDARVIAATEDDWSTVVLAVQGAKMAAWVNGVQVSNWQDDRQADENPRKGKRTDAGTIMIQGHDETTELELRQIQITP
ncbi:3-keto-disaccharide hydrolase [Novipirellula aureliae]|nr:DUF1080 domain-containing protein [Novipirellula aureliae]